MDKPITSRLSVQKNKVQDESGFNMQLEEISFNGIDLRWGEYTNPADKVMSFHPQKNAIVSHFRLQDPSAPAEKKQFLREKQFVVYREQPGAYDLPIPALKESMRYFFELAIPDDFFDNIFTPESLFLQRFRDHHTANIPSLEFSAQMPPLMYSIIHDMQQHPYSGHLQAVYLEAKAIELFLLQVKQLDQQGGQAATRLKPADIERLHAIRDHMARHYTTHFTINELSRKAGINQMKLKSGFKELFNTTVFGYLRELRMEEARRLLLQEKLYVNEVADRMGYKHPHHFTAAFKKKFGIMPRDLKK